MIRRKYSICLVSLALLASTTVIAQTAGFNGGHAKYQFLLNTFPDNSLFRDYADSPAIDNNGDLRIKFGWQKESVSVAADYQLIARQGDLVDITSSMPGTLIISRAVADDNYRLFDMTRVISEHDNSILAHRLDRFYIDVTSRNAVARFGRQAISWGNGLVYTPMDFFNPFDPAAIDKEYKTGDDMLYGQYLKQNGDDLQAVWVIRRDFNGNVSSSVDSIAAKYHGFAGSREYDLLLAEHFDDYILGFGGLTDLGTALWRGDITITHVNNSRASNVLPGSTQAQNENVISLVTSLSWSWVSRGHNVSGIAEYFYNGFGQANEDYSPAALAQNPALAERIIRGELFTLGRHYLALSAVIEMTPLWLLTPNVFINAGDGSFLAQLVSSYDLQQNWQLLAALGLPVGADGTEFGGIDTGIAGKQLSMGPSIFAQLAWYF